jgi:hypothetical protein
MARARASAFSAAIPGAALTAICAIVPAVVALVVLLLAAGTDEGWQLNFDGTLYTAAGLALWNGGGLTGADGQFFAWHPPLLPALLSFAYTLDGGPSYEASVWVVRFFGLLAIAMTALLAGRLAGRWAALAAGLLAAVIPATTTDLFVRINPDLPCWALGLTSLVVAWEAYKRDSVVIGWLAGGLLALSFLAKETGAVTAAGLLAMPLFLPDLRGGRWPQVSAASVAPLALALPAWVLIARSQVTGYELLGPLPSLVVAIAGAAIVAGLLLVALLPRAAGAVAATIDRLPFTAVQAAFVVLAALAVVLSLGGVDETVRDQSNPDVESWLDNVLAANLMPGWLIVVVLLGLVLSFRQAQARFLLAVLIISGPLVFFALDRGLQLRQALLFSYLLIVATAVVVVLVVREFTAGRNDASRRWIEPLATGVLAVVFVAVFLPSAFDEYDEQLELGAYPAVTDERLLRLIEEQAPEDRPLILPGRTGSVLYFVLEGRWRVWDAPAVEVSAEPALPHLLEVRTFLQEEDIRDILHQQEREPWRWVERVSGVGDLGGFTEAGWARWLQRNDASLVIMVSDPGYGAFLNESPAFQLLDGFPLEAGATLVYDVVEGVSPVADGALLTDSATLELLQEETGLPQEEIVERLNPAGLAPESD